MNSSLQRTSSNVGSLADRTITPGFVVFDLQVGRHGESFGVLEQEPNMNNKGQSWAIAVTWTGPSPALYIPTSSLGPGFSRPTPKKRGDGRYPPLFWGFFRGGSQSVRPLLTHHKKASLLQSTQTQMVFMRSFLEWCGLLLLIGDFCGRGNWSEPSSVPPVAACWSIKPVCTPPWLSLRPV